MRDKFTKKLHKAEDLLKLPLEYLGIFALAAPEPVKDRRNQVTIVITETTLVIHLQEEWPFLCIDFLFFFEC